jgi:hypothetical protein
VSLHTACAVDGNDLVRKWPLAIGQDEVRGGRDRRTIEAARGLVVTGK